MNCCIPFEKLPQSARHDKKYSEQGFYTDSFRDSNMTDLVLQRKLPNLLASMATEPLVIRPLRSSVHHYLK
jgi:hypothetical protein